MRGLFFAFAFNLQYGKYGKFTMRCKSPYLLIVFLVLFGFCETGRSQYSAESIAARIARDSNGAGSESDYMDYSVKLASLLSKYSPDALQRILGVNYVKAPSLNDQLDLGPLNFGFKSPALTAAAKVELDKVFDFLNENPDLKISMRGHTSLEFAGSVELSESRALAARLYLATKGIDVSRMESSGAGFSEPMSADFNDPANRRIDFEISN